MRPAQSALASWPRSSRLSGGDARRVGAPQRLLGLALGDRPLREADADPDAEALPAVLEAVVGETGTQRLDRPGPGRGHRVRPGQQQRERVVAQAREHRVLAEALARGLGELAHQRFARVDATGAPDDAQRVELDDADDVGLGVAGRAREALEPLHEALAVRQAAHRVLQRPLEQRLQPLVEYRELGAFEQGAILV